MDTEICAGPMEVSVTAVLLTATVMVIHSILNVFQTIKDNPMALRILNLVNGRPQASVIDDARMSFGGTALAIG